MAGSDCSIGIYLKRILRPHSGICSRRRSLKGEVMLGFEAQHPLVGQFSKAVVLIAISVVSHPIEADAIRPKSIEARLKSPTTAKATPDFYPRSDSDAASRVVRRNWEPRPDNDLFNHTVPTPAQLRQNQLPTYMNVRGHAALEAVTGHYTGTTDEILQWGAHKWGFDPDLVRANAMGESSWHQKLVGDVGNGVSLGILQIKSRYHPGTCPQSPSFPPNVDPSRA